MDDVIKIDTVQNSLQDPIVKIANFIGITGFLDCSCARGMVRFLTTSVGI